MLRFNDIEIEEEELNKLKEKYPEEENYGTAQNISGLRFRNLVAIYKIKKKSSKERNTWLCICDCGNHRLCIVDKIGTEIFNCGRQCPFAKTRLHDLKGKKFGKLTVIERNGITSDGHAAWLCKCDCGNTVLGVAGRYLENGRSQSCGKCPDKLTSIGEKRIREWLEKNSINFVQEYRIPECKNKSTLPFDFAILEEREICFLIEYQGIQHYEPRGGWSTPEQVVLIQERDKIKKDFCVEQEIPLLVIPYTELDSIEVLLEKWVSAYAKI